jgi:hypothetical protein
MQSHNAQRCTPNVIIEVLKPYHLCNDIINLIINFCFWETTDTANAILLPDRRMCMRLYSEYPCSDNYPCSYCWHLPYLLFFIDRNKQYKVPIERVLKRFRFDTYDSYESIVHKINIYIKLQILNTFMNI